METKTKILSETIKIPESIQHFQNRQNLEHLIEKIKILKSEIESEGSLYGITNKVINKIFSKEEVIQCKNCGSPNAYRTCFEINGNSKSYKCDSCKEYFTA